MIEGAPRHHQVEIAIRITFPRDYPESEPIAFDAAGRFPVSADRHIIKGGQFCLWLPPCSPWDRDDPRKLLRFLDEVTVFLERLLIFDATGGKIWPGDHYKHGAEGYEDDLRYPSAWPKKLAKAPNAQIRTCFALYRL
jgi:hypothetical protein